MQGQIIRTQTTCNLMLRDIKQWASRIEDGIKSRNPFSSNSNDSLIVEILPLSTVQTIQDFDSLLRNTDEAVTQFVSFYINHLVNHVINFYCTQILKSF